MGADPWIGELATAIAVKWKMARYVRLQPARRRTGRSA